MGNETKNPEILTTQSNINTQVVSPVNQVQVPLATQIDQEKKSPHVRKSFLIVTLIVFSVLSVLGLVAIKMLNKQPENNQVINETPNTNQKEELFLSLDQTNLAQAVNGEVLISGKTLPNTSVILVSDIDDEALESNAQGVFEGTVLTSKEAKTIKVTAYGEDGKEESVVLETLVQEG